MPNPNDGVIAATDRVLLLAGGTLPGPLTVGGVPVPSPATRPLPLLIPAYQYPTVGTFWASLEAAGGSPVKFIVANVTSGPGTTINSDYTTAITAARAAGITVLGYVDTNYGGAASSTVAAQVAAWNSLYGVTSVFLDRAGAGTGTLGYYTAVIAAIRAAHPGQVIALNHGAIPDPGYAPLADILVVFEDTGSAWAGFTPAPWMAGYPPSRFAALVHTTAGQALAASILGQVQAAGIGYGYVTDDTAPNPYDVLPAYWAAEVAQAKASFGGYLPLAGGTLTGVTAPAVVALADGVSIAVNAALGNDFRVTLGGNRTIAAPSNPVNGQQIVFHLTQDATGSRTVTWASTSGYDFGATGAPVLTTAAAKTDLVAFVYNSTIGKWLYMFSALGN